MRFGPREMILFLSVLLLPIVSYFVVFRPQTANINNAKSEIAHKQDMLNKLRSETSRNEDLIKVNEDLMVRIDEMESLLPSDKEVDQIVRQVSSLAIESGLTPPSLKSVKPIAAAQYREQPLEMKTTGSFEGFYKFLIELERLPRITRIVDMKLKDSTNDGVELEASFTLSIYFQNSNGGAS